MQSRNESLLLFERLEAAAVGFGKLLDSTAKLCESVRCQ